MDNGTFGQGWLCGLGSARQPHPFALRNAQIARLACAGQDDRATQINRILRHMPAPVDVGQRVIGIVPALQRFGGSKTGELCMEPCFGLNGESGP